MTDDMEAQSKFSRWLGSVLAPSRSLPTPGRAVERPQPAVAILRHGTLGFTCFSTMGGFVGSTTAASGMVEGDLRNARGWVEAPVATLSTRSRLRDRDMRAALEVDRYPTMRFDLARVDVLLDIETDDASVAVELHGRFSIHGVTRVVALPAIVSFDDESIHLISAFPLDVEEYRIGGLTRLYGLLRMQKQIEVRLDLLFTRLNGNGPILIE